MSKLTKEELKSVELAASLYAKERIVDLNDYEEDSSPEVTWFEYYTDATEAFMAGVMWAKENLKK